MTPGTPAFLELVSARRGHFRMESGYHSALWLDLDALFRQPTRVAPFVSALTGALESHAADAVCGPMVGGAFLAQLAAQSLGVEFWYTRPVGSRAPGGLFQARYELPRAFHSSVRGKRVAVVDDVMSAGSSLRATVDELRRHGAIPVAVGALLILGTTGSAFFAQQGLAVEVVIRDDYELWAPTVCPMCARGEPLEDVGASDP